jgi:hypothetical protein
MQRVLDLAGILAEDCVRSWLAAGVGPTDGVERPSWYSRNPHKKTVLECADGSFSCILMMNVWWHKLEIDDLFCHEFLEDCRGFIVQALEFWMEAGLD